MANAHRFCFLLVEKDEAGLSPRKLLIESTKHNVLTAYSPAEATETFDRFPGVDAVGIDMRFGDKECKQLVREMRGADHKIKIVAFMAGGNETCSWADETVEAHDPKALLKVLEEFGQRTDIA